MASRSSEDDREQETTSILATRRIRRIRSWTSGSSGGRVGISLPSLRLRAEEEHPGQRRRGPARQREDHEEVVVAPRFAVLHKREARAEHDERKRREEPFADEPPCGRAAISAGVSSREVRSARSEHRPPPTQRTAASTCAALNHWYQVSASGIGAGIYTRRCAHGQRVRDDPRARGLPSTIGKAVGVERDQVPAGRRGGRSAPRGAAPRRAVRAAVEGEVHRSGSGDATNRRGSRARRPRTPRGCGSSGVRARPADTSPRRRARRRATARRTAAARGRARVRTTSPARPSRAAASRARRDRARPSRPCSARRGCRCRGRGGG